MKWLEIVELRATKNRKTMLESLLKNLFNEVGAGAQKQAIRIYSLVTVDTDFSVHLRHDSEMVETTGSPLGLQIKSALKEFGLVSHTIWREIQDEAQISMLVKW